MIQLKIRNYSDDDKEMLRKALEEAYDSFHCPTDSGCRHCKLRKPCLDILQALNYLEDNQ